MTDARQRNRSSWPGAVGDQRAGIFDTVASHPLAKPFPGLCENSAFVPPLLATNGIFEQFTDLALFRFVISRPSKDYEEALACVHALSILRELMMGVLAMALAPMIAGLFDLGGDRAASCAWPRFARSIVREYGAARCGTRFSLFLAIESRLPSQCLEFPLLGRHGVDGPIMSPSRLSFRPNGKLCGSEPLSCRYAVSV